MDSESKGNFIIISPDESMKGYTFPIAIFNISGINEEDIIYYYPIVSNFYDTVSWFGTGTLQDLSNMATVPPQALEYRTVNKIVYNNTVYWLSDITNNSLTYRSMVDPTTVYIQVNSNDNWATYTISHSNNPIT